MVNGLHAARRSNRGNLLPKLAARRCIVLNEVCKSNPLRIDFTQRRSINWRSWDGNVMQTSTGVGCMKSAPERFITKPVNFCTIYTLHGISIILYSSRNHVNCGNGFCVWPLRWFSTWAVFYKLIRSRIHSDADGFDTSVMTARLLRFFMYKTDCWSWIFYWVDRNLPRASALLSLFLGYRSSIGVTDWSPWII